MHKYLRAIGFSKLENRLELQKLLTGIVIDADKREYTSGQGDSLIAMFSKDFAPDLGIAVCGEFDEQDKFTYDYYYPYFKGTIVSSEEDVSVERHIAEESYAGVCEDIKVGISIVFYLQNMIPYVKAKNSDILPIKGTTLTLSGLSTQGTIMMPLMKTEKDLIKNKNSSISRSQMIDAARRGDEEAIESLTLEDMDTYSIVSRRIQNEDVFSLVDTYFMPYGVECDLYSVLGEIEDFHLVKNTITSEEIYQMTINCNDLVFDIAINKEDLFGEPAVGRRFKGSIWMQGNINFPQ